MGKAIYANIAGDYYQINQCTKEPSVMIRMPKTHCAMEYNDTERELTASVWLSGIENTHLQSNRGLYADMTDDLKENSVTEIPKISDQYVLYLDYSIYNEKDEEINHSCTTKRLDTVDAVLPLGCAMNNELVYRRVKSFNPKIEFSVTNRLRFGIMCSSYGKKYTMKINDICILESISPDDSECYGIHGSIEENSYSYKSHSISSLLKYNIPVYSSANEGIDLGEFTISFYPRKVTIDLHLVLANLIVTYDDQNIKDILEENKEQKGDNPDNPNPDPGPGGDDDNPGIPDPKPDPKPDPDPDPKPDPKPDPDPDDGKDDDNGFYYYYERCISTNPDALVIVDDTTVDEDFDEKSMVRLKDVLADIPDAVVGEYVRYATGFDISKL